MPSHFEMLVDRRHIGNMKGGFACPPEAVNLSGAEMDFATAPVITQVLSDFAARGLYGFTLADDAYIRAILWWMKHMRSFSPDAEAIVPTLGTVFGLSTALRAFTKPGDGVILQHPSYSRFDRAVVRNGRKVISNPLRYESGSYRLDLEDLEEKMRAPQNRLLLLCNPHNPTGRVFSAEELKSIAYLAQKYDVIVFSDEIFAEITQPGHPCPCYAALDPAYGMSSTSLGKAFNFTGVNQANLLIPNQQLRELYIRQQQIDHFGSIDPFFYNALLAAYSPEGAAWIHALNAHLDHITCLMQEALADTPIALARREGSFVAWLDCRALAMEDDALDDFWLNRAHILADPGHEYGPGGSGFVRLNIATTTAQMTRAMDGLTAALQKY